MWVFIVLDNTNDSENSAAVHRILTSDRISTLHVTRCFSLSGQGSPPHKRFHISLELIWLDYVMEIQYCWERAADFFQVQISDISY